MLLLRVWFAAAVTAEVRDFFLVNKSQDGGQQGVREEPAAPLRLWRLYPSLVRTRDRASGKCKPATEIKSKKVPHMYTLLFSFHPSLSLVSKKEKKSTKEGERGGVEEGAREWEREKER